MMWSSFYEGSFSMFWTWFFSIGSELTRPVRTSVHLHIPLAFRILLFSGDFLVLMVFWYIQQNLPYRQIYDIWLAGFAATLGILLLFTMGSARIHGYRLHSDPWIGLASALMFALGLVSVINSI
jgi:hypothetical protein